MSMAGGISRRLGLTMSGQVNGNCCEVTREAWYVRRPVDERAREAMQQQQRRTTTRLLVVIVKPVDLKERHG